ncbi:MAG: beta-aspartyl-peptidase [Bacteroidales bacterium]|nr:beta-aspartyl-peptidase [Bacteroidales bacterium]
MVKLLKSGMVYTPEKVGKKDILIAGGRIIAIADTLQVPELAPEVIDASGLYVCPGFIDQHVHITGGGGQFGFASFIPELFAGDLLSVGTTTVVGLLGTDGFVKELTTLYAKAKALEETGVSSYMLTSYYGLPEKTLCGSVADDMIFVDKVIGCKLAISDDRSSFPTRQEILRLINKVRLGGFSSGKVGILHIHLGALDSRIDDLLSIAREFPTLIPYISPTHCSRTQELFFDCIEFAKMGGMIDISTGGTTYIRPHEAVAVALERGAPLANITFSTDGRGGVKRVDPVTGEVTYKPAPLDLNHKEMTLLVEKGVLPLEDALKLLTVNVVKNLKIKNKGRVEPGYDADFVLLDEQLQLRGVIARGKKVI